MSDAQHCYQRSYAAEVLEPIQQLAGNGIRVDVIGGVRLAGGSAPLLKITIADEDDLPLVILNAGTHGDEPAAVAALLAFLREDLGRYRRCFRWLIFPCTNPWGYESNQRGNQAGRDLNREFGRTEPPLEVAAVMQACRAAQGAAAMFIDLHEDNPVVHDEHSAVHPVPGGYYLYERSTDSAQRIAAQVLQVLSEEGVLLCRDPFIYGDTSHGGLVLYGVDSPNATYSSPCYFDSWLLSFKTALSLVLESPVIWDFKRRSAAHRQALGAALDIWLGQKPPPQ